jgi:hypothetical protein
MPGHQVAAVQVQALAVWNFKQNFTLLNFLAQCTTAAEKKGKGKEIPLHAWTGPEGSRRLSLPDFKTIGKRRW